MQAHNRALTEWFNRIRSGQVRLPRFQRHEAWGHNEVAGLIETVLRGLPAGAVLTLEETRSPFLAVRSWERPSQPNGFRNTCSMVNSA
jgi:hypothetical protein